MDAPIEILETGVPVIVQMPGRFAWLDDDTLAITTFADPSVNFALQFQNAADIDATGPQARSRSRSR